MEASPHKTGKRGRTTTMACFVVRDHNGQQLAYVYFEDEPSASLNKTADANALLAIPDRHRIYKLRAVASGQ